MAHDFGEGRHGADLQTAILLADAAELIDLTQIDNHRGLLDAVLQPIKGVQSAGHNPGLFTVPVEQPQRVVSSRRLKEFECRHDIANDRHFRSPRYMWAVRPSVAGLPASSD